MLHIGMLIEQKVHEQGRSVQWLAGRLSCHRTNVYDIFHRPTIDSMLLQRLCLILQYDFFSDLSVEVRKEMYPASLPTETPAPTEGLEQVEVVE